tara:strand:- start:187 stop:390 length:204 start_codon:yes stop_codon:yes gene_type:complete
MPGHGFPKLLYALGNARVYSTPDEAVALFWRGKPVALFRELEAALDYMVAEFVDPREDFDLKHPWTE